MRCGRTFRLARTHPAHARSSGSETLSRSRSLADYTIDMHESEFSEATGVNILAAELTAKRLELFRELLPGAARMAVFINPNNPVADATVRELEAAARAMGLQIQA